MPSAIRCVSSSSRRSNAFEPAATSALTDLRTVARAYRADQHEGADLDQDDQDQHRREKFGYGDCAAKGTGGAARRTSSVNESDALRHLRDRARGGSDRRDDRTPRGARRRLRPTARTEIPEENRSLHCFEPGGAAALGVYPGVPPPCCGSQTSNIPAALASGTP
jgi:hypothetical protein